ncbi:MAG: hypothetical protein ACXVHQ_17435 [Solirubrobacteraceae bacterium]
MGVLASVADAQAAVITNTSTPLSLSVFVPCANGGAGEIVDLSGRLHTMFSLTVNGNNFSSMEHFQPQGVSGTGEATGAKYQATGVTQTQSSGSFINGQAQQTFINRFDIIGQGPGNNFSVHETAHLTFNANGTATVFFDNFTTVCK